jgi:hypothetical protein
MIRGVNGAMMNGRGRQSEIALRAAERRRREDEAPRLSARVPKLETLVLEIEERRPGAVSADVHHTKRVVVTHAPALFDLTCCDRSCKDGGHDITRSIMYELDRGSTDFEGEDTCHGALGSTQCSRVLRYKAKASYKDN